MGLASVRRLIASRRLGWVLALALWLPMAQWAVATHTLLHLHAVAQDSEGPAHLPESCDTCVVAATLVGAAPPATSSPPLAPPPAGAQPLPDGALLLPRPTPAAAYDSRAPPSLHA
jgi:hypothetical protein